jgi:hypothetical protein
MPVAWSRFWVSQSAPPPNPLLELVFTLVLPSIALDRFSKPESLGPFWALVAGLAFPVAFGAWCFFTKRGWNVFSVIGLVTILLSGGLGLLKLDAFWIGMKESLIATAVGVSFPLSHYFGRPLMHSLVMQPQLLNVKVLQESLADAPRRAAFDRALFRASCMMGLSMVGSAVANFLLAVWILGDKEPGSEAFVKGLGRLNWVSTVVLGVPMMAVMLVVFIWLLRQIQRITGLERDDLLNPGRTVRSQVTPE